VPYLERQVSGVKGGLYAFPLICRFKAKLPHPADLVNLRAIFQSPTWAHAPDILIIISTKGI
jgi:hypothetical protein